MIVVRPITDLVAAFREALQRLYPVLRRLEVIAPESEGDDLRLGGRRQRPGRYLQSHWTWGRRRAFDHSMGC